MIRFSHSENLMAAPDPTSMLLDLLRQQTSNQWVIVIVTIVAAAGGAYFASYFTKRGEYRALRENFEEVRLQQATTTRDTEEIKQQLAGRAWQLQQTWSARERYYSGLLAPLHGFKLALEDLSDYFLEPGTEHMPESERGENYRRLKEEAWTAYSEVKKLVGPSAIFLTPATVVALDELFTAHWALANFEALCDAEWVKGALRLAETAYDHVLLDAQVALGIKRPPSTGEAVRSPAG